MCENKMRRKFLILLRLVLILLAVEAVYADDYFGELTGENKETAPNSYTTYIYNWFLGAMGYVSNMVSYVGGFAEPEQSNVRVHTTLLLSRIPRIDRSKYNAEVIAELYNSLSTNPNYLDIMKIIGEVQPEKIIPLIELASETFKQNQEMHWQNKGLFIRLLSYIPKKSLCKKFINILLDPTDKNPISNALINKDPINNTFVKGIITNYSEMYGHQKAHAILMLLLIPEEDQNETNVKAITNLMTFEYSKSDDRYSKFSIIYDLNEMKSSERMNFIKLANETLAGSPNISLHGREIFIYLLSLIPKHHRDEANAKAILELTENVTGHFEEIAYAAIIEANLDDRIAFVNQINKVCDDYTDTGLYKFDLRDDIIKAIKELKQKRSGL